MGFTVFLLLSILLSISVIRSDYPPPSEDGHSYYLGSISRPGAAGDGGGSFVTDWVNKDWSILSGHNQVKCLNMPANLTLCKNVGYSEMRLPNLLQHDTLKEVTQQASTWVRLANVGCHPDTQKFLCSLFAPICLDQPIWPCRTLCEAVKNGCENKMLKYGFPWPEMLRCDQFPVEPNLCIGIPNEEDPGKSNSNGSYIYIIICTYNCNWKYRPIYRRGSKEIRGAHYDIINDFICD